MGSEGVSDRALTRVSLWGFSLSVAVQSKPCFEGTEKTKGSEKGVVTGLGRHDASDNKPPRDQAHERERDRGVLASITDSTASRSATVRRAFTGTRSTSPSPIGSRQSQQTSVKHEYAQ
ncbi:hypothetical protein MUK42_33688 [Musa troglodytarum]|uniref:Uncharacterized protein n=1 Tax=Musa troglodytarum TaxID=320322 RepID=A0A9E7KKN1_9LILI|nr:hypothetical protein MUK42_33688 [Musa troglodytarum]